jgi:hypothetical protein
MVLLYDKSIYQILNTMANTMMQYRYSAARLQRNLDSALTASTTMNARATTAIAKRLWIAPLLDDNNK